MVKGSRTSLKGSLLGIGLDHSPSQARFDYPEWCRDRHVLVRPSCWLCCASEGSGRIHDERCHGPRTRPVFVDLDFGRLRLRRLRAAGAMIRRARSVRSLSKIRCMLWWMPAMHSVSNVAGSETRAPPDRLPAQKPAYLKRQLCFKNCIAGPCCCIVGASARRNLFFGRRFQ